MRGLGSRGTLDGRGAGAFGNPKLWTVSMRSLAGWVLSDDRAGGWPVLPGGGGVLDFGILSRLLFSPRGYGYQDRVIQVLVPLSFGECDDIGRFSIMF